jgi:hypothetical protein
MGIEAHTIKLGLLSCIFSKFCNYIFYFSFVFRKFINSHYCSNNSRSNKKCYEFVGNGYCAQVKMGAIF